MMDDIIRRHDAISAYKTLCQGTACKGCPFFDSKGMTDCRLLRALRKVQSAQPKKGKWINNKHDLPICNQCGYMPKIDRTIDDYYYSNYCPNCGARMVNEDDDNGTD